MIFVSNKFPNFRSREICVCLCKIHRDGLQFPPEVIDYIAENVNESVRDLEGIVIAIMARSTIFNKEIDLDLAQQYRS